MQATAGIELRDGRVVSEKQAHVFARES